MVSDGVLDGLPGEDKEGVLQEFLEMQPFCPPKELAGRVLEFACSFEEEIRDDMTVLAAGIWKKINGLPVCGDCEEIMRTYHREIYRNIQHD